MAQSPGLENAGREAARFRAGNGPPLVLLHGLGGTWRVWQDILPIVTRHTAVLALTLPGHAGGPAIPPGTAPTLDVMADWVATELDREGFRAAHVAGNSLGGSISLELARRGRALSVVAVAPIGFLEPSEAERLIRQLRTGRALASRLGPVARALTRFAPGRHLLFRDVLNHPAALAPEAARQWLDAFVHCPSFDAIIDALAEHPPAPLPAQLGCPVCIVWPGNDRLTPEQPFADRFAAALPDATRVRLAGCGHIPMPEVPDQVAAAILDQVRACESGASAAAARTS